MDRFKAGIRELIKRRPHSYAWSKTQPKILQDDFEDGYCKGLLAAFDLYTKMKKEKINQIRKLSRQKRRKK